MSGEHWTSLLLLLSSLLLFIVDFIRKHFMCHFNFNKVYSHMKEMEMELPQKDDNGMVARVKRMHFYSVREEFIIIWNFHEQFLVDYEERLVRRLRNQAKIGKFNRMTNS